MTSLYLSKSQFIRGLQCHKSLWLYKNRQDLRAEPDSALQATFDEGTDVGILAQKLFPGGHNIEFEGTSFDEKVSRTQKLIDSGVETIYEATFQHDDILVMVDILHKGPKGWDSYEVKKSTAVKLVHEEDVAVQYYVVNKAGLPLNSASLVHINNQYTRRGELDVNQLFTIVNLTEVVQGKQNLITSDLEAMRTALEGDDPEIDIGPHCSDPYQCDFSGHCWTHIPNPSVFNLSRMRSNKKFELYNSGVVKFEDLPEDYPLSQAQKMQVEAELTGTEYFDAPAVRAFLDTIHHPLYYLDFETFNPAVPPFDDTRPYQRIPFQYSLHYQENWDGELQHVEFLAEEGTDPREELVKSLVENISKGACVLTYNRGFEQGVIRELAEQFPRYGKELMTIHDSILDLMAPFQSKAVYKKEMNGSYSIKTVLPALIPEMGYDGMEIGGGGQASSTYATLHLIEDSAERRKIRQDLLEYCKLDTLAMIKIIEKLNPFSKCLA